MVNSLSSDFVQATFLQYVNGELVWLFMAPDEERPLYLWGQQMIKCTGHI